MSVPRPTLLRVFWRCLFLQAAWNRRGMQNLGFAYAIAPALRRLYTDPARRRDALRRHLDTFNCHPYTAAAIVGGAIHHEERVAAGEEPSGAPLAYKQVLQGPLAALGDGFFWVGLRPAFGAIAALGTLALGWPALVAALATYNVLHLWLRWTLFRAGYRAGDAIVDRIAGLDLPRWATRLRGAGTAIAGMAAGLLALRAVAAARTGAGAALGAAAGAAGIAAPPPAWTAGAVALAAALVGWLALARGARLLPSAWAAMALGAGAALAMARLAGGF
jgi:PTS system mannose-specific IID component